MSARTRMKHALSDIRLFQASAFRKERTASAAVDVLG